MTIITTTLSKLRLGNALTYANLVVFPLICKQPFAKDYLTLDEALREKTAKITEVSEHGSVPELLFRNLGDKPVFLLDGEELTGCKQNRILNISVLVEAGKVTVIPVSCVEAGRWGHSSREFESAPRVQFSKSRGKKAAQVSANIAGFGTARSDQGEIWNDISSKLNSLGSYSSSDAVEEAYVDNESALSEFVKNLAFQQGQVGAVFTINGKVVGIELFDASETCQALLPKIVRSYALDAIDPGYLGHKESWISQPGELLDLIKQAPFSEHPAVGMGEDLRFDRTPGLSGGALYADKRVVHLCGFMCDGNTRAQYAYRAEEAMHN